MWVPGVPRVLDVQRGNDEPPAAALSGGRRLQNTLAKVALCRCGLLFVTKAVPSIFKHFPQIRNGREIERHRSTVTHASLQIAVTTANRHRRYCDNAANFSVRLLFFMRAIRMLRASTSACCDASFWVINTPANSQIGLFEGAVLLAVVKLNTVKIAKESGQGHDEIFQISAADI